MFLNALDSVAPSRQRRVKQRSDPWVTNEILECIHNRDLALYNFRKFGMCEFYENYKFLRNEVQRLVRKAKVNYFTSKIEDNKNNPKNLWKSLKDVGMPSKKSGSSTSNIGLTIDGELNFDKKSVACEFNQFFTTVASKLVDKLPVGLGKFSGKHVKHFTRINLMLLKIASLCQQLVKIVLQK